MLLNNFSTLTRIPLYELRTFIYKMTLLTNTWKHKKTGSDAADAVTLMNLSSWFDFEDFTGLSSSSAITCKDKNRLNHYILREKHRWILISMLDASQDRVFEKRNKLTYRSIYRRRSIWVALMKRELFRLCRATRVILKQIHETHLANCTMSNRELRLVDAYFQIAQWELSVTSKLSAVTVNLAIASRARPFKLDARKYMRPKIGKFFILNY